MDNLDTRIKALVDSGELVFKDAKYPTLGIGAWSILVRESAKAARATSQPVTACYREACAIYWRLHDER